MKKCFPHKSERQAWILEWLKSSRIPCADSCGQKFHKDYKAKFPQYALKQKFWGAEPVKQAMLDLKAMHQDGKLERFRIGLGINWQPGFPKWVWSYTLSKNLNK